MIAIDNAREIQKGETYFSVSLAALLLEGSQLQLGFNVDEGAACCSGNFDTKITDYI